MTARKHSMIAGLLAAFTGAVVLVGPAQAAPPPAGTAGHIRVVSLALPGGFCGSCL